MGPFSLPASKETRGIHNVAFPRRIHWTGHPWSIADGAAHGFDSTARQVTFMLAGQGPSMGVFLGTNALTHWPTGSKLKSRIPSGSLLVHADGGGWRMVWQMNLETHVPDCRQHYRPDILQAQGLRKSHVIWAYLRYSKDLGHPQMKHTLSSCSPSINCQKMGYLTVPAVRHYNKSVPFGKLT